MGRHDQKILFLLYDVNSKTELSMKIGAVVGLVIDWARACSSKFLGILFSSSGYDLLRYLTIYKVKVDGKSSLPSLSKEVRQLRSGYWLPVEFEFVSVLGFGQRFWRVSSEEWRSLIAATGIGRVCRFDSQFLDQREGSLQDQTVKDGYRHQASRQLTARARPSGALKAWVVQLRNHSPCFEVEIHLPF